MQRSAFAKLNLNLHITGKQDNGYHTLRSLIAFADVADEMEVSQNIPPTPYPLQGHFPAPEITLYCRNHIAVDPAFMQGNLVAKAAQALRIYSEEHNAGGPFHAHITLEKNLPLGAGLGGGSSDAAAALILLNDFWKMHLPHRQLSHIARTLGSDISACLTTPQAQWMTGTGNTLKAAAIKADLWVVLVYPNVILTAKEVYAALDFKAIPKTSTSEFETVTCSDNTQLLEYLHQTHNDLTRPATHLAPVINDALAALEVSSTVQLVRMSGSGSACFGLYLTKQDAIAAATSIATLKPDWWVKPAALIV